LGYRAQRKLMAGLVTHTSKSAVGELLRVTGLTVGSIITGVVDDARGAHDPFEGLRRIGIDEISYGRGHKYLTVVVDHDSGPLVWDRVGQDKATLEQFFDLLGQERSALVKLVSADAAEWIATVVGDGLSNALVESTNTKLRLLTRVAYGFKSTDNLIALCLVDRGGYCPPLPGRQDAA
jgi:transposase